MSGITLLLLQIVIILLAARVVGWVFRSLHQPQVMGEMIAGILLGPSLLGWLAPGWYGALFPPASFDFINALSQVGLVLFMFLVGLELNLGVLRQYGYRLVAISNASVLFPFALGVGIAVWLYPVLAKPDVTEMAFVLFSGASMSITAFPVLARILSDHNLTHTRLGTITITCAAVDDVSGWLILAGLLILVKSGETALPLWQTLLLTLLYLAIMLLGMRRLAYRFEGQYMRTGRVTQDQLALVLLIVLLSSLTTQWLGIHPLFGAFLAGAIMPRHDGFIKDLTGKLYDPVVVLLLPMFFVYTGLRTRIGLINGPQMWLICAALIITAIAGKFGGSTLAARLTGLSWREATALGVLMNARGLMELVLLNIGLETGVISQKVFTMLVIMAIITTLMTAPILEWVYLRRAAVQAELLPSRDKVDERA